MPSRSLPDPVSLRGVTLSVRRSQSQKADCALLAAEKTANHLPAVSSRTTEWGLLVQQNVSTSPFTG